MRPTILAGDCLIVLDTLEENSIDAVVTDPPYELGFMGRSWDASGVAFCPRTWEKVLRVMKPGAHLVAFGAPKNYHRLACAIEDAGFEIRDSLMWVFSQGFPKSHNLKDEWSGWGTALKPAYEPIVLARKPLSEKTVAANVQLWGTGAINIDATRVEPTGESKVRVGEASQERRYTDNGGTNFAAKPGIRGGDPLGRWPANLAHDGSDEVVAGFPQSNSTRASGNTNNPKNGGNSSPSMFSKSSGKECVDYRDEGSAARFFYCAKASKADRAGSRHPTVKPVSLMRWLVRMITPPGGTVLDPFAGSGTTGQAAMMEDFHAMLIEREAEYLQDIERRLTPTNLFEAAE